MWKRIFNFLKYFYSPKKLLKQFANGNHNSIKNNLSALWVYKAGANANRCV